MEYEKYMEEADKKLFELFRKLKIVVKSTDEEECDKRPKVTDEQIIATSSPNYFTRYKTFTCVCGKEVYYSESTAYKISTAENFEFRWKIDDGWHLFTLWRTVPDFVFKKYSYDGILATPFCDTTPPSSRVKEYSVLVCAPRCPVFLSRARKAEALVEEYKKEENDWVWKDIKPRKYPEIEKYIKVTRKTDYCDKCGNIALQFLCRNITEIGYRRGSGETWKYMPHDFRPKPVIKWRKVLCDDCAVEYA